MSNDRDVSAKGLVSEKASERPSPPQELSKGDTARDCSNMAGKTLFFTHSEVDAFTAGAVDEDS